MIGFVFLGPILFAAWVVVSNVAQTSISNDFVAQVGSGGDIYNLLDDIADDSSIASVGASLFFPAVLGILVAMVYVPLQAMRTGLLTRMFATLGMAFGASLLLIAPQFSLLLLSAWFAWLGFTLILDRVPKGRPPAWDAAEAIPWPSPVERPSPQPPDDAVVEGDATELFSGEDRRRTTRRAASGRGRRSASAADSRIRRAGIAGGSKFSA